MGPVVVAVGVGYNGQPGKVVLGAKDRPAFHPVPRVPDSEPVTEKILGGARHLELHLDLPVPYVDGLYVG